MKSVFAVIAACAVSLPIFVLVSCGGAPKQLPNNSFYSVYNGSYAVAYGENIKAKNLDPAEPHPAECPKCEGLCLTDGGQNKECEEKCEEGRKQHPSCSDEAVKKYEAEQIRKKAEPQIAEFVQLSKIVVTERERLSGLTPSKDNENTVNYVKDKCRTGFQIIKALQDGNIIERVNQPAPGEAAPKEPIENYFAFGHICSEILEFETHKDEYEKLGASKEGVAKCRDFSQVAYGDEAKNISVSMENYRYTYSVISGEKLEHKDCEAKIKGFNNAFLKSVYGASCGSACEKSSKYIIQCFAAVLKEVGKNPAIPGDIAEFCNSGKSRGKEKRFVAQKKPQWEKRFKELEAQRIAAMAPPPPPAAAPSPPPPPPPPAMPPTQGPPQNLPPPAVPPQALPPPPSPQPPQPVIAPQTPPPQQPPAAPMVAAAPMPLPPSASGEPPVDIAAIAQRLAGCKNDPACAGAALEGVSGKPVRVERMLLAPGAVYIPAADGFLLEVELQSVAINFRGQGNIPVRAFLYIPMSSPFHARQIEPGHYRLSAKLDGQTWHAGFGIGGDFGAFIPVIKVEGEADISK